MCYCSAYTFFSVFRYQALWRTSIGFGHNTFNFRYLDCLLCFYLPYDTISDTSATHQRHISGAIMDSRTRGSLTHPKEEVLSGDAGCLMIREETVKDSHYDNISP